MDNWITLLYTGNIVNHLYFNLKNVFWSDDIDKSDE